MKISLLSVSLRFLFLITGVTPVLPTVALEVFVHEQVPTDLAVQLESEHRLTGPRDDRERYYVMDTELVARAEDGKLKNATRLILYIQVIPTSPEVGTEQYICRKFLLQRMGEGPVTVSRVVGLTHTYLNGIDENGQVFGIDHAPFRSLSDDGGNALSAFENYWVYNTFVDFHVFVNAIPNEENMSKLSTIGDRAVHTGTSSTAPIDLLGAVGEGSEFKNGDVAVQFDGLGLYEERPCGLVSFEAKDNFFHMSLLAGPGMQVDTDGYTNYGGTIWIGLKSRWAERVDMGEVIVSLSRLEGNPIDRTVTFRTSAIRSVSAEWFVGEINPLF